MATSLASYLLVAVSPTVLFWLAVRAPRLLGRLRRRRPRPVGPPLELLAADLRRLRHELAYRPPPTYVRRTALLAAYDEVLVATCRAVSVSSELPVVHGHRDREFERLRTEAALEAAGVRLSAG